MMELKVATEETSTKLYCLEKLYKMTEQKTTCKMNVPLSSKSEPYQINEDQGDPVESVTSCSGRVFKHSFFRFGCLTCPILSNTFHESHLELAYQRYSHRQRQISLIIVNFVDLILKVS